ncbi:PaaI family thioesterase [Hippea alviniae]|uniref:PaaI family thioesterase n=1 Tax=Hippea alviniae TaxID=1279027 RepID=UPI0003B36464|nr:hotdog fold thioesterase [Hippea alviniae]
MNLERIKAFLSENDRFGKLIDTKLVDVKEGYAKAVVKVKKEHLNAAFVAQGGLLFSLADFAFAAAANSYGRVALAINGQISFLKPAKEGDTLTAEAKEISRSLKVAVYRVDILNDKQELIATFTGTAYFKDKQF